MEEYLNYYGWHFSPKMAEWASSRMYKKVNNRKEYITPYTKSDIDILLKRYNMEINCSKGHDCVYIANMCKADFLGSSIPDEMHLIKYVKDVVDDVDAYDGMPFTRFYADCIGSGTPINWSDML